MTEIERSYLFHVTYQTRLGMMCERANATDEQHKIAWDEATETVHAADAAEQAVLL